tara:strand:+ start:7521 stop:7715 length:195 start_codon:yes stop_codon:yes gene_type:complete
MITFALLILVLITAIYAVGLAYMQYRSYVDYHGTGGGEYGMAVIMSFFWPWILWNEIKRTRNRD